MTSEHAAAPKPGYRAAAWVAWFLCAPSAAFAAFGLLLLFFNGTFANVFGESVGVDAAVAVAFPAVGAVVASRRPRNAIGWLFCAIGLSQGAAVFFGEYATYALVTEPGALPAGTVAFWLGSWTWLPGVVLTLTFLLLLFPDGRLPSRRWRPVAWLSTAVAALGTVVLAVTPWDLLEPGLPADNPFGPEGVSADFLRMLAVPLFALGAACALLCALSLVLRFRRSSGEERQQLKWFVYASVLYLITVLLPPSAISNLQIVTAPMLPIAAGIAILKHRLFDIDLIINRTLVYGALTACVVGIYVLIVGYLGTLFRTGGNLAVSLVATGIVAVLFAPLHHRLQRAVNRLMYGERDDPYAVLSRLGERLEATLEPEAVLPTVARTVREALKVPYAAVALGGGKVSTVAAEAGAPVEFPLRLPLVYRGETVGELLLGSRVGEEEFSPADLRLLEDLTRQAGVAVHAVRLTNQLQRSRERLVTAREEERRRLRRDLHDGLGPTLGSLPLKLDVADDLMEHNPAAARELLRGLKFQARNAVADIRRLVYELRPPALDDLGLLGAVRETAAQHGANGLRISVEAPDEDSLPPLPAAVEVAAYRIVQEAVTNVSRHARARECAVRLFIDDETRALRLQVEDDGRGISEGHSTGVGLHSMRERAEELGGSCVVEPQPGGGTRVRATLPLSGGEE